MTPNRQDDVVLVGEQMPPRPLPCLINKGKNYSRRDSTSVLRETKRFLSVSMLNRGRQRQQQNMDEIFDSVFGIFLDQVWRVVYIRLHRNCTLHPILFMLLFGTCPRRTIHLVMMKTSTVAVMKKNSGKSMSYVKKKPSIMILMRMSCFGLIQYRNS